MAGVSVHVDTSGIVKVSAKTQSRVERASYRAGTDASRRMSAEGNRQIRAAKNIKVAALKDRETGIRIVSPKSPKDAHVWKVRAGIIAQPVFAFGPRQTKKGISVTINKGSRTSIAHAFIATMKSGHTGVFMRYGEKSKRPTFGYKGKAQYARRRRQPIRELWTTRISDAFKDAIPAMAERGRTEFVKAFTRNMRAP